jgi:L-ascorbate metabolism protein UlaG (beta-lactamase superfamily)
MKIKVQLIIMGLSILQIWGCSSKSSVYQSENFDGKTFYNPTLDEEFSPGFSDILRMSREGRTKWPKHVENQGIPKLDATLDSNEIAIRFVNHATFLIQLQGLNILTDPVWSKRVGPFGWIGIKRVREPGITIEELPPIDLILISHSHYDHLDLPTLKLLKERFSPKVLVSAGNGKRIKALGFKNVHEMLWWETNEINPGTHITFTPTQHTSRRGLFDANRSLWGSFFIKANEKSIYFSGDAAYSSHFRDIKERLGAADIALLGIGDYLPRWFMKDIHMEPAEAVMAHKDLEAIVSISMHDGTFQNSSVAFGQARRDLDIALEKAKIPKDDFISLEEGESRIFQIFPAEKDSIHKVSRRR